MTAIPIRDEAHWRELRSKNCGGSEVSAIFGLHPQITKFELWHRKFGTIPEPDLSDNERVFWGTYLEPSIAKGIGAIKGIEVEKVTEYLTNDACPGMSATLDYRILSDQRGLGALEIKTVDGLAYRDWEEGEPPVNYQLQLQHQLACSGYKWGMIGVLIGGNRLETFEYEARPATIAKLESGISAFWQSIRDKSPPKPDFSVDLDTIRVVYKDAGSGVTDMSGDNYLRELCSRYTVAAKSARSAQDAQETAKAEIITKIGPYDKIFCGDFTISAGTVEATHVAYDRKGYRNFRLSQKKDSSNS